MTRIVIAYERVSSDEQDISRQAVQREVVPNFRKHSDGRLAAKIDEFRAGGHIVVPEVVMDDLE